MTTLVVLGAIVFVVLVIGAVLVRRTDTKIVEPPLIKAQLDVISARARKRRSDFGIKRGPRAPKDDGTGMSPDEKGWIG